MLPGQDASPTPDISLAAVMERGAVRTWFQSIVSLKKKSLFGVEALDPLTYAGAALAFGLVAAIATYIPSRRASRVDPMIALREE